MTDPHVAASFEDVVEHLVIRTVHITTSVSGATQHEAPVVAGAHS